IIFIGIVSAISIAHAEFTEHFRDYLTTNFGDDFEANVERIDMGIYNVGSFGGKLNDNDTIVNRPIIFVHGVTLRAGIFLAHRDYFIKKGYKPSELYATTYADGGITPMYHCPMRCNFVREIRDFIEAVHKYANSTVDIIAYSMGASISRKAILGGKCMDTDEDLGPPLTNIIETYVAVGGVCYGLENCKNPRFDGVYPACSKINGMTCSSFYMHDINVPNKRYEGKNSFAIYSKDDHVVGQNCCGHTCSELKNANMTIVKKHYNHGTILTMTKSLQYSLVRDQKIVKDDKDFY
uniref:Lipase EstA/Esterase EstB family-containing protein n=1 Tax=Acrobeloides nanus TaxID=290746 RepID=A0A914DKZ8_9BILA